MENRLFDSEEQDDSTSKASSNKKKRGSPAVSKILAGWRRKEQEGTTENDNSDEKPKRFRRIFSKLFPKVVEKPELDASKSPNQGFDSVAFSLTQLGNRTEAAVSQLEQAAQTEMEPPTTGTVSETTEVSPKSTETDIVESQSVSTPENATQLPNNAEITPGIDPVAEELPEPQQISAPQGELFIRHQDRVETPVVTNSSEKEPKEVVIERGPGIVLPVALVGLEHLGRKKADRKLEKRVNEKIMATNKEVERSVALQQELQTLRRQNNEQLEALKQSRVEKPVDSFRPKAKAIEQAPISHTERAFSPEKPTSVPEMKEQPRVVERQVKEEIKPERILEQVADAAEHDLPVERIFERSHEVKDDNTIPVGAASVGSVVSTHAAASQYQALQHAQSTSQLADEPTRLVSLDNDPVAIAAYKQAIKFGFWTAIMIIILGSIAYLMVK